MVNFTQSVDEAFYQVNVNLPKNYKINLNNFLLIAYSSQNIICGSAEYVDLNTKMGFQIAVQGRHRETEGTVCSCLYAEDYIDNDLPLVISTLDMYFEPHFNPADIEDDVDGAVVTFYADNPAYSYSELGRDGYV